MIGSLAMRNSSTCSRMNGGFVSIHGMNYRWAVCFFSPTCLTAALDGRGTLGDTLAST